jgi:hypothetical protein
MKLTPEQKAAILQAATAYDAAATPYDKRNALYDFHSITEPHVVVAILRELEDVRKELSVVVHLGFDRPLDQRFGAESEDKARG